MKKIIISVIVFILFLVPYLKTDGYSHIRGIYLSYNFSTICKSMTYLVWAIAFVYTLTDKVKEYVKKENITPFRDI